MSDVPAAEGESTRVSADQAQVDEAGRTVLTGNVNLRSGPNQLAAEQVIYDREAERAEASGSVVFSDGEFLLEGDRLELNLNDSSGTVENASYALRERGARGRAVRIIRHDGRRQTLEQAQYTTCPAGKVAWELRAGRVDLDLEEQVGTARNARVWFKGVPIAYTPYISFPLTDARKSGLLSPRYGSSEETGADISIPYYWNIAPNRDAIISPRFLTRRGTMLESEVRYLEPSLSGIATMAYLPNDDRYGSDRKALFWNHSGSLFDRLSYYADYNYVSDNEYFEDLGDDLASTSTSYLQRLLQVSYGASDWLLTGSMQSFQTLEGVRPYKTLPRIDFETDGYLDRLGLAYDLGSELANFRGGDGVVDGTRADLYPRLSYPVEGAYYSIEPAVALRYTAYDLNKQFAGLNSSPDRFTPIASLDAGLFFERDLNLWGLGLLQTLEPRLYYLYTPETNQRDIPLFDTTELDFGFSQLFRENRFSSADRQSDANQVTLALTSRMLNDQFGTELLRASVGQIIYFEDREVSLIPTAAADNDSSSEWVTALAARLTRNLTSRADWQWDPDLEASTKTTVGLFYRSDARHIFNLAYRSRIGLVEQTDLSFAWPVAKNWTLLGRNTYSLHDNQQLETFAGMEYRSCCWAVRGLYRQYVNDDFSRTNQSFMIQLELTGLGNLGNRIEDFLTKELRGYSQDSSRYGRGFGTGYSLTGGSRY